MQDLISFVLAGFLLLCMGCPLIPLYLLYLLARGILRRVCVGIRIAEDEIRLYRERQSAPPPSPASLLLRPASPPSHDSLPRIPKG